MVEATNAYKQGWYERIWLKCFRKISDENISAIQEGWMDGQTNMTDYIGPYDPHMDQRERKGQKITQQHNQALRGEKGVRVCTDCINAEESLFSSTAILGSKW